jgi:hypothetical protein
MGGAKGDLLGANQPVSQLSQRDFSPLALPERLFAIDLYRLQDNCQQFQDPRRIGESHSNYWLKIVLRVDNVPKRSIVEVQDDGLALPDCIASQNSQVFQRHGIALLGHDTAGLDKPVREMNQPEVL